MPFTTTIAAEEVARHLRDPDWVVLDARFSLDDEGWGEAAYLDGHVPGARHAHLGRDLAGPIVPGKTGRRPLPTPAGFAATLSRWGVGPETQVVTYDASGGLMAAARAWWMLRWVGHDRVAVLDGGLPAWSAAGLPVAAGEEPAAAPARFTARERPELVAVVADVEAARTDPASAVFDSRGAEGYHGRGKYHDPVRGHIKGARLADRAETLGPDGKLRAPEVLRAHYAHLLGGVPPARAIFYCGSGVTAAQNLLALAHAGLGDARHYVGSWSEWILDPARAVDL
jgi:thiosulfate/3-mercaptopyruvate sulfurtransferase